MSRVISMDEIPRRILALVPHYDDEVLGFGGTLAQLAGRSEVRLVYVTSGRGSENLGMPGVRVDPDRNIGEIRRRESLEALTKLGWDEECAEFFDVPDFQTGPFRAVIYERVVRLIREHAPEAVWVPFRFDRHVDHVNVSRIGREAAAATGLRDVWEYFVYYRWRLLRGGDVRAYVRPEWLVHVDIAGVAEKKRAALERFVTQTTRYFDWQTRPVLSAELIAEVCAQPEAFLRAGIAEDAELFSVPLTLIRCVHAVEPPLKRFLDRVRFVLARRRRRC